MQAFTVADRPLCSAGAYSWGESAMAEHCVTCDAKIASMGIISRPNFYIDDDSLRIINFVHGTDYEAMCRKCGGPMLSAAYEAIRDQTDELTKFLEDSAALFPMMTLQVLPADVAFTVEGMVTSNVAVGTGLINEFSQGLSDFFGSVNLQSGMAHKVNKGEAAARAILARKALQMGANCIIGVDIDYGTTTNNAATVNMQGTAVRVADVRKILSAERCSAFDRIMAAWNRLEVLRRWQAGSVEESESYTA